MDEKSGFHAQLYALMDDFVLDVYSISKSFPKDELYGVTSQLRRATLSVILNYVEGYARRRDKVYKNCLEISYGSLKESKYLIYFSCRQKYMTKEDEQRLLVTSERIGKMLWGIIVKI